jgi:cytochrome c peroxidase
MWHRRRKARSGRALALLLLVAAGCQPAGRYPQAPPSRTASADETSKARPAPDFAWLAPRPRLDIPIRFVDAASSPKEWKALPAFWNHEWGGFAGQRTAHVGLSPLGALVALRLSGAHEVIKIKVPLGLPNPAPQIPAVNPPTHGKWLLGKKLFFDRELLPGPSALRTYACADCHKPDTGYTLNRPKAPYGQMNVPTLINCVYNRHQFWDGRAEHLEEVIQRNLDDEGRPAVAEDESGGQAPEVLHRWRGVVRRLRAHPRYVQDFVRVFGTKPTQDNVAKAIATYLRTLLSGNSVYDRAEAARAGRKGEALMAADFRAALDDNSLKALAGNELTGQEVAAQMRLGHTLFHGKARCTVCHGGPLFTDHDFHNVGIGESEFFENERLGRELGRFPHLPPGLKARRYIGAFKTPTLRALPRTGPYMHDGSRESLASVLNYFNRGTRVDLNSFLDPELRDGYGAAWHPDLTAEELRALEMFLKSLDGEPVPSAVAVP